MNEYSKLEQSAVILAGGKSARMGRDKAFLEMNGKSMIQHLVNELVPITSHIFISAAAHNKSEQWPKNTHLIIDRDKGQGPLHGLIRAFKQIYTQWIFVLSVDAPSVSTKTILDLWHYVVKESRPVVATSKGKVMPLIGWYKRESLNELEELYHCGERRMMLVVKKLNPLFVELPSNGIYNINTPNAYKKMIDAN